MKSLFRCLLFSALALVFCVSYLFAQKYEIGNLQQKEKEINLSSYSTEFPAPFYFKPTDESRTRIKMYSGRLFSNEINGMLWCNPCERKISKDINPALLEQFKIASIRFYQKPEFWKYYINTDSNIPKIVVIGNKMTISVDRFFIPFYFKKTEVTNAEYKEFIDWVINAAKDDSVEINVNRNKNSVRVLFSFVLDDGRDTLINIYPDTTCWTDDFVSTHNKPLPTRYFGHPAYNNHPVVGVNWFQAKAFCQWKTARLKEDLAGQDLAFEVQVDLPYEYEREYVVSGYKSIELTEQSWLCDLTVVPDKPSDLIRSNLHYPQIYKGNYSVDGQFVTHVANINLLKTNDKKTSIRSNSYNLLMGNLDENGISAIGSNVSEWMNESYLDNWHTVIIKRHQLLSSVDYVRLDTNLISKPSDVIPFYNVVFNRIKLLIPESLGTLPENNLIPDTIDKIATSISILDDRDLQCFKNDVSSLKCLYENAIPLLVHLEQYYDGFCATNGRLVRGCNWFDERFSSQRGINTAGANVKTFVSPDESHSTIGFRYVIRVNPKN